MNFTLEGRTAVVDGGSGELGVEVARAFLDGGMNVCIVCSKEEKAKAACSVLTGYGDRLLATWGGGIRALDTTMDKFGGVDVIFPLNGTPPSPKSLEDITPDYFSFVLHGHCEEAYSMMRKAVPYLEKSKAPRVLFLANDEAQSGGLDCGLAYNTAKGGVIAMTYSAAKMLAPKGITVNCIAVGSIYNRSVLGAAESDQTPPPELRTRPEDVPLGRLGTPQDVAAAACFLASEEAGFITGEILNVSGGLHMG